MRGMAGPSEFSKRMARVRKERGWSRAHLADMAGIGRVATIHEMERGEIREPRHQRAEAIARALGVSLSWLWGEGDSAVPALAEPVRSKRRRRRVAHRPASAAPQEAA